MRNRKKYKFHDLTLSSTIKHAYQAMAIDERRGLFDVNLWKQSKRAIDENIHQHVEQRWFAGVHCEVGGGYHEEQLSDLPLLWMIHKAQHAGLYIDMDLAVTNNDFPVFLAPDVSAKPHDSLTFIFKLSKIITRKIGRENGFNECIDASVLERIGQLKGYGPVNVKRAMDRGVKVAATVDIDQINNHSYTKQAVV